jgi:hypothetical protein
MEDWVFGFSGLGSHGCIGLLGTDRNHQRTVSNRRKLHLRLPDHLWFCGSFGFHTNGSQVLEPSEFSLSGLAGCGSRPRRNRHWNRRISVLATIHRGSGPLGSEFSSLSPDLLLSLSRSLGLISVFLCFSPLSISRCHSLSRWVWREEKQKKK